MAVIYHLGSINNVAFFKGHKAYLWADSIDTKTYNFNLKNHLFKQGVSKPTFLPHQNQPCLLHKTDHYTLMSFAGKTFLILPTALKKNDLMQLNQLKVDYCVLQNKPIYSLAQLLAYVQAGKVLVSASNPKTYSQRLKKEADSLRIPLHVIAERGAWVEKF